MARLKNPPDGEHSRRIITTLQIEYGNKKK